MFNRIEKITIGIMVLHLFVILGIDMQWLQIIKSNQYFDFAALVDMAKNINKYYIFFSVVVLSVFSWHFNKNSIGIFYAFLLIYTFLIIKDILQYFINISIYNFSVGEIILIPVLYGLLMVLYKLLLMLSIFRTDKEILKSGFNRKPNTIKDLISAYKVFAFILLFLSLIVYYLLLTPINIVILLLLLAVFLFSAYKAYPDLKIVYQIHRRINKYGYDDGYIELREKINIFPMMALDKHEYNLAMYGFTGNIPIKIEESKIFEVINEIHNKKINFKELKNFIEENKENINDIDGAGWTPFMKYVADNSRINKRSKRDSFRVLNILLGNGADINIENFMDRSALNFAIGYGDLETVKFLVENNALIKNNHIEQALKLREAKIYNYLKENSAK